MPSDKDVQIGNVVGFKPESRTFGKAAIVPVSDHYIGIEIEAENINVNLGSLSNILSYWSVVTDGSLRNNGAEFITGKLRGKDIENALHELNDVFTEYELEPEYSHRTSVHIHADMRGLTLSSLQKVLLCYGVVEPYLFKYIGKDRTNNPYCIPWYKSNETLSVVNGIVNLEQKNVDSLRDILSMGNKYSALNISAIRDKGSIEFRHHYGTHNPDTLINWISTILSLIDNIKQYDKEYVVKQANKGGTYALAQEMCAHIEIPNDTICHAQSHRNIIGMCSDTSSISQLREKIHAIMHGTKHPSLKDKRKLKGDDISLQDTRIRFSSGFEAYLNTSSPTPQPNRRRRR